MRHLTSRLRADIVFCDSRWVSYRNHRFIDEKTHVLAFDLCKDFGVVIASLARSLICSGNWSPEASPSPVKFKR
jgi:hypothetical protein